MSARGWLVVGVVTVIIGYIVLLGVVRQRPRGLASEARNVLTNKDLRSCGFLGWQSSQQLFKTCLRVEAPPGKFRFGRFAVGGAEYFVAMGPIDSEVSGDLSVVRGDGSPEYCLEHASELVGVFSRPTRADVLDRWSALEKGEKGEACAVAARVAREVESASASKDG